LHPANGNKNKKEFEIIVSVPGLAKSGIFTQEMQFEIANLIDKIGIKSNYDLLKKLINFTYWEFNRGKI
jgi:hypothetical protein